MTTETPEATSAPVETFATKLKAMRADLASIVDRMNRDGNYEIAVRAQTALMAVDAVPDRMDGWFEDLEWSWQPMEEDDE